MIKDGNISLLIDDSDKRVQLENADPTFIMKSAEEKADILIPFVQTRFMINEAVSLEVKFTETMGEESIEGDFVPKKTD